jgi:RHS repeat-associated protein
MKNSIVIIIFCLFSTGVYSQVKPMAIDPGGGGGGTAPAAPPRPTASTNVCGNKTLTRGGTPPSGVLYYWQNVVGGFSTEESDPTLSAATSGTYYQRAQQVSSGLWSSAGPGVTITVNPLPAVPSTPTYSDDCSTGTITRGTPPSGISWYWQGTNSAGTSTADASATYVVSASGTYYLRAYNNSSGCWSASSTPVIVTLTTPPSMPPAPNPSGGCGSVLLSFNGTPPALTKWYWETTPTGTATTNATSTLTVYSSGTYYLRAFDMNKGCWSSAAQTTVTVNPLPPDPNAPTASGTCGTSTLSRGTPPGGVTWYWQGGISNGTSTSNSSQTYLAGVSGTFYLRARYDATGCWSANSSSVQVTVNPLPATPAAPTLLSNCGTAVLGRQVPPTGETYYWQSSSSGTSTSNSASTLSTSTNGTFYLGSRNNTTLCWSATNSSLTVAVIPVPALPGVPTATGSCGSSILSHGTPPTGVTWYFQGTTDGGSSPITTYPATYTATSIGTFTYYLRPKADAGLCWGPASSLSVTINPAVTIPTTTGATRVEPGLVTLNSTLGTSGSPDQNRWYTTVSGGTNFTTGLSYSPSISGNTTYYVSSYNSTTNCESSRVAVTGTVTPKPSIVSSASTLEMGNTITLSTVNTYTTYSWMRDGVAFANTPTVAVAQPGTYTVTVAKTTMTGTGTSDPKILTRAIDSQPLNYVIVNSIQEDGITLESDIEAQPVGDRQRTISYLGGFGNTLQQVASQTSPSKKDLVMPVEYDVHGRQLKNYLPYVSAANDSKYRSAALNNGGYTGSEQYLFYQSVDTNIASDTNPFTITELEPSPLGRVTAQTGVGSEWHANQKKVTQAYLLNRTSDNIRLWTVGTDGLPTSTAAYSDYQLRVQVMADENGNQVKVWTDKLGRTVQKATEQSAGVWLTTVYIYNDLGQLAFMLSPEGVRNLAGYLPAQTYLDKWAFQYHYDAQGRLIESRTPAEQGWRYIVYDALDRPVMSQNPEQTTRSEWTFVKYDIYGRAVVTGYKAIAGSTRTSVQASVDAQSKNYEITDNTAVGYTLTNTYPSAVENDLLSISYYDNYNFLSNSGWDAEVHSFAFVPELTNQTYSTKVNGLPTGGKARVIRATPTSQWLNGVQYYDAKYRPIQMITENHLNGLDRNTNRYALGRVEETLQTHQVGASVKIGKKFTYDHANRIIRISQSINGSADQVVAQYEYNELGQLVDRKLHDTGGSNFMQSVDYRYSIRGWLLSINNAALTNGTWNDDSNDYFGMVLMYEKSEAELGTPSYNGNITAVKWKGPGSAPGLPGRKSYSFTYDKADRLTAANFKVYGSTSWDQEVGSQTEAIGSYDDNGNIQSLQRNQRKYDFLSTNSYKAETVDDLTYTYSAVVGNQLIKVEDATSKIAGFKNGVSNSTEYTYDKKGSIKTDDNKGVISTVFNVLDKPYQVTMSDGYMLEYTYSAGGDKLAMKTYLNGALQSVTDYVNGMVYENNTLKYFGSPEGRVVKNGSTYEYQYSIADHQGNTRVLFTSAAPVVQAKTATIEAANQSSESGFFIKYPTGANINPVSTNNHTAGGTNSLYLNGGNTSQVSLTKSFRVFPGDQVSIQAYARYNAPSSTGSGLANFAQALLSAFNLPAPVPGETGTASAAINYWGGVESGGYGNGSSDNVNPKAFVNIIIYDKDFNFLDIAFAQVNSSGSPALISASYAIKEDGYAFVYVSNEHPTATDVYFDDVNVTYTPTNIIQYNEYYPFGLQASTSWTRTNNKNDYKYNAASELNNTSGWYEMFYRGYDPALGRMLQVDPLAASMASLSPYNFAFNNPFGFNDPMGDKPLPITGEWHSSTMGNPTGYSASGLSSRAYERELLQKARNGDQDATDEYVDKYGYSVSPFDFEKVVNSALPDSEYVRAIIGENGVNYSYDIIVDILGNITYAAKTKATSKQGGWVEDGEFKVFYDNHNLETGGSALDYAGVAVDATDDALKAVAINFVNLQRQVNAYGLGVSFSKEISVAKNAMSKMKWAGRGVGLINSVFIYSDYRNNKINDWQMATEQASNAYSTLGGVYGASWGIGWEIGRGITTINAYQDWKHDTWLPFRKNYLHY